MADNAVPLVLELAPLPREQIGPFLILGVDKAADSEQIEAHWAQRVIWARKNQFRLPLEDINWAREVLRDADRRVRADLASLDPDLRDETLRRLAERYSLTQPPTWAVEPEDDQLAAFTPDVPMPDEAEIRRGLPIPEVPTDLPGVAWLLDQLAREPLDPWDLNLELDPPQEPAHE
jgi:hypothetical protein